MDSRILRVQRISSRDSVHYKSYPEQHTITSSSYFDRAVREQLNHDLSLDISGKAHRRDRLEDEDARRVRWIEHVGCGHGGTRYGTMIVA